MAYEKIFFSGGSCRGHCYRHFKPSFKSLGLMVWFPLKKVLRFAIGPYGPPIADNLLRNLKIPPFTPFTFARPAEHWSGARWPFGARGAVPGRAIKTEESLDSVAACGNAGIELLLAFARPAEHWSGASSQDEA